MSSTIAAADVVRWLRAFADAVARERDHLTELDAAIGDADHGANMDRGMQAVAAKLSDLYGGGGADTGDGARQTAVVGIGALLKTAGMTLTSTVGGAAGPLYGTLFLRMGVSAGDRAELTMSEWAAALEVGVKGVQERGRALPGDKTMVDALLPAAAALTSAADTEAAAEALRASAAAAEQGMKATIPLVARKGRASYLGERSAGHQDPGATSSWLLLQTAAETLAGDDLDDG
jgi:phosphoenolpyruvate---glycerone phosphotransferase subunit DhaL